jgi:rare lipoprotein A
MKVGQFKIAAVLAVLFLAGCSSSGTPELSGLSPQAQALAIKQYGGVYKVGNPYQIMGKWYYPKEDYSYSEVGTASWYGEDFHAKRTANGEKYDMNTLTAAHRTLPLPSIVRVTNLENGRSLVLRVNDRGPYAKERIIDISKRGAQLLGYQTKGTTKVRVEILEKESKALKAALLNQAAQQETEKVTLTSNSSQNSLNTQLYIQAGSFTQKGLADNLCSRLSSFGKSRVSSAAVNGSVFYRVRLGPFSYEEEAEVTLNKLRNNGIFDAKIIRD